jgi:penicillin-binding protein 1B
MMADEKKTLRRRMRWMFLPLSRGGWATFRRYLRAHPRVRRSLIGLAGVFAVFFCVVTWLLFPYLRTFGDIGAGPGNAPSRLYAAPLEVRVGETATHLMADLEALGYSSYDGEAPPHGRYREGDGGLAVRLRRHMSPQGPVPGRLLLVEFRRRKVESLRVDGQPAERVELDVPVLATWYGGEEAREKWPVQVADLPEHVVHAVLAAEDDNFYWHPGVSPTGIIRALFVNLRRGEVAQGGSTLTQQLVKNVFLTSERSLFRKIREAVIAVAVEVQHSKREVLQGYLNGIYLGGSRGVQYYGVGTAARAYFGKDATELTLEEAAVIAGMIKSPAAYSPVANPERARERRDAARLERALGTPVETAPLRVGGRTAPHFADAMANEVRERFGLRRLGNRGHHLFSTLSLRDQATAEKAVADTLKDLDRRGRRKAEPLEAALISTDPRTGAILSYVGGRDYSRSEFDRVSQAHRQAGSTFKPIVLVAALETGKFSPATSLKDEPLTLKTGGARWTPKNSDGAFLGPVTARTALEQSRNVPLIRLAMDVGLDNVADTARRMGIESRMEEVPALALGGGADVTPREIATVYSTLASGGVRPVLHGLAMVLDPEGSPVKDLQTKKPERVLSPQVAYITTAVLEGVVERGTGSGVRRYGIPGHLAGKTGTTNDARDSWFAGYRPDRVTVVWVGRDNPGATTLSGSRAALPIWGRYMKAAFHGAESADFSEPDGLEHATVCRDSGLLARTECPSRVREVFLSGQKPRKVCELEHAPPEEEREFGLRFSDWLKGRLEKIFGEEEGERPEEQRQPEGEQEEQAPPP